MTDWKNKTKNPVFSVLVLLLIKGINLNYKFLTTGENIHSWHIHSGNFTLLMGRKLPKGPSLLFTGYTVDKTFNNHLIY